MQPLVPALECLQYAFFEIYIMKANFQVIVSGVVHQLKTLVQAGTCQITKSKFSLQADTRQKFIAEMLFCPRCANLLSTVTNNGLNFNCPTCTYSYAVEHKMVWRTPGNKKKLDDVQQYQDHGQMTNFGMP